MLPYALAIFTGAFLLFQLQPIIGKYILPWFGGGPGVWTTCMLFFQVLLLGGYAYAHGLSRWLRPRAQGMVHLALAAAALALLPIIPGAGWKPQAGADPTLSILALLAATVGLPYLVVSATGPLLQSWYSANFPGRSPYRLYALSNAGSLLALVSYPFVIEPHLARERQAAAWGLGLGFYTLACAVSVLRLRPSPKPATPGSGTPEGDAGTAPSWGRVGLWIGLPACASVLLLAVTNKLCQDVAVIPFLWIAPLSLYLLSFIICFDHQRWYRRLPFSILLTAALAALCVGLVHGSDWAVWQQIALYCAALFVCCMACHGELYRLRPAPARLTSFYMAVATGGAIGGLFAAVGAPLLFKDYYELHWGMMLTALLFIAACVGDRPAASTESRGSGPNPNDATAAETEVVAGSGLGERHQWQAMACILPLFAIFGLDRLVSATAQHHTAMPAYYFAAARVLLWSFLLFTIVAGFIRLRSKHFKHWRFLACLWMSFGAAALAISLWNLSHTSNPDRIYRSRNFYGVLTVYEHHRDDPKSRYYLLQHGRITHGLQFTDPEQAKWPTSYYSPQSGVALALSSELPMPRRIGVVGLGTGSLAAFARDGDHIRFYEINPEVVRLANSPFRYLPDCAGKAEVALGDARLSMEREPAQSFDVLALDAFSSDSIPVHLLTKEAFALYERHLKPEGIIAVHISNHYLDLEPVVAQLAEAFHYHMAVIDYEENSEDWWLYASTWVLLSRDSHTLASPEISAAALPRNTTLARIPLWTDDFVSLFQILR